MNKSKKWYVALGIAAMITVNGIAMAAVTADQKDTADGKRSGITWKADRRDMKDRKEAQSQLLAFLKIDDAAFRASMKEGKTLATIAKEQGVSEQSLQNFLTKQMTQRLEARVKAGKLTAEQAEKIKADIPTRVADMINGKRPMHRGGHMRGHAPFNNPKLLALLNIDAETLKAELKAKKPLVTIANEHGVSEQQLKAFMVEQMTQRLEARVKAGKLSAEQAEKIKAGIPTRVADLINGKVPMHKGPGHMKGHAPFNNPKLLALLNIDAETLKAELKGGKTLVTIANEQGVSEQQLKAFMIEQMTQRLEAGIKEGRLTAEQAEKMKKNMAQHVDAMINGKGLMHKGHGSIPGHKQPK